MHAFSRARSQQRTRFENPTPTPSCWRCPSPEGEDPSALDDWPGLRETLTAVGFTGAPSAFARVHLPRDHVAPARRRRHGQDPGCRGDPRRGRHRHPHPHRLRDRRRRRRSATRMRRPARRRRGRRPRRLSLRGLQERRRQEARRPRVVLHGDGLADAARGSAGRCRRGRPREGPRRDPGRVARPGRLRAARRRVRRGPPRRVRSSTRPPSREAGFGGILGVGQGSDRPPRLVRLDYAPADADAPRRARRQGHHLRHRRPLAEARRLHGRHEVRHVRRGDGARGAPRRRRARRSRCR